ncbi:MAG: hypothetical protein RIQ56_550 [Candidatus Parcubacteria bacterium]
MEILFLFGIPLFLANCIHQFVVIPLRLLSSIAIPIDTLMASSRQIFFGSKKTLRGFVVISICTGIIAFIAASAAGANAPWIGTLGLLVGFIYMLGELPNSFLKRRLGIAESSRGDGAWSIFFRIFDHCDSTAAATLAIALLYSPLFYDLLLFFSLATAAHVGVNVLLRKI